ncbi:MAG: zinc ABC transporter substrate-binding protein [Desulfosarcinaceae bacterium]|nr:zinc ABC transporter substrate-binding protein [Desulfosarcinaceae bacterium]
MQRKTLYADGRRRGRELLNLGAILIAMVVILGNADRPAMAQYEGDYPYRSAATVGMLADIVVNVAGDKSTVTQVIGAGVDPHVYNPTRSDLATLLKADVIFQVGLLLEGQMGDALDKIGKRRPVFAIGDRIDKQFLLEDAGAGHPDPHVWMDVQGWMRAVAAVADALGEFDPANGDVYTANAQAYIKVLEALDAYAKRVLASIPADKRIMITAHDAFSYLGRAYGIEVVGIQGLSTESEAGLKDINRIVGLLVERQIPAVFVETSVSDKNVKALIEGAGAKGHRVRIGGELFSDAMGRAGTYEGTYVGMIDHNVTTIARALGGEAPAGGMQGKLGGAH